jgi:(Z)-2-((N-methylformamido)methylene)-5-hydroxybutyrolactone dehydrogenase
MSTRRPRRAPRLRHGWSKTTPGERARLLNKVADLLDADADRMALLETTDNGKVIRETHNQMGYAARIFRYYAGWADKMHGDVVPLDQKDTLDLTIRVPLRRGRLRHRVELAGRDPHQHAARRACRRQLRDPEAQRARLHDDARRSRSCARRRASPPGVVQVVTGAGEVGAALTGSTRVDKISFTGSPAVGRRIARRLARTSSR